ncbi:TIGR03086 family metal-binding protein [Dactylosporangium sp. McL0621]|uniref:TIGR03086 family metal-binding protein n=1 Tax=Dactylosporangium sp. McL0621 TaxID=3415678 RepID=UPI003CE8598A
MTTIVDRIETAIATTGTVVAAVVPALASPSPCPGWTLRDELNHLVGGMRIFAAELSGTDAGGEHESDWLGADAEAAYAAAAALDRAAWRRPGALDGTVRLGFGVLPAPTAAVVHLTEVVVHGADLAVSTGQERHLDEEQCAWLLATMEEVGMAAFRRPGMFGAERPCPADAPAHRRLLAYLGRDLLAPARRA